MLLLSPDPQLVPQAFFTSREHPAQGPGGEDPPLQGLDSHALGLPPGRVPSLPFQKPHAWVPRATHRLASF